MVYLELGVVALKTLFKGSHYIQNLTPCIYIYNPVLEHSELQSREKTVLKQEVFHCLYHHSEPQLHSRRKAILRKPKKFQVIASPGAPFFKLRQSLESGALEDGESTPDSLKDILVETSTISLNINR